MSNAHKNILNTCSFAGMLHLSKLPENTLLTVLLAKSIAGTILSTTVFVSTCPVGHNYLNNKQHTSVTFSINCVIFWQYDHTICIIIMVLMWFLDHCGQHL